jgi:DNA ligase-1
MTAACREAGCQLPEPLTFEGTVPAGHALICPPNVMRSKEYQAIPNLRTAILSGWALDKNATHRFGVDAAFPLSDHADFPGLLDAVRRVNPRRIVTIHGYTKEFSSELRRQNYDARSVDGGDQMEFDLPR